MSKPNTFHTFKCFFLREKSLHSIRFTAIFCTLFNNRWHYLFDFFQRMHQSDERYNSTDLAGTGLLKPVDNPMRWVFSEMGILLRYITVTCIRSENHSNISLRWEGWYHNILKTKSWKYWSACSQPQTWKAVRDPTIGISAIIQKVWQPIEWSHVQYIFLLVILAGAFIGSQINRSDAILLAFHAFMLLYLWI